MSEFKQVIVMRKDLNMRKGKMCAQAAHASMKAYLENKTDRRVLAWLAGQFAKICVSVDSENELNAIYNQAIASGLIASIIVDAGRTEFDGVPTKTCIAIGPDEISKIDLVTGDLKLL